MKPIGGIADQPRKLVASITYDGDPVAAHKEVRRHGGYRVYNKSAYTAYRDSLAWLFKDQIGANDPYPSRFAVTARISLRSRRKIDLDNLLKPIIDAATGIVWVDDRQVDEIHAFVLREQPDAKVEVMVYIIGANL